MIWTAVLAFLPLLGFAEEPRLTQMKWSGDIRVRMQNEKNGDNESRTSPRIRVRIGMASQLSESLKAELRLASAKSNRSSNQTLGDSTEPGSRRRYLGLDLAYAEYSPYSFFKLYAGRIPQVHYRPGGSQILLDEDIALEGASAVLDYGIAERWKVFLGLGSAKFRENYDTYYSEDTSDNDFNWGQTGVAWEDSSFKIIAGAGFFNYTSVEGKLFSDLTVGGSSSGNSEGLTPGTFKYPFLARQYFVEGSVKLGSLQYGLFAEQIENREAADQNKAWWLGGSLTAKSWDSQVAYAQVNKDSVPGVFTNSDFAGGTTDSYGWVVAGRYKPSKGVSIRLTEFINHTQGSRLNKEYLRTHLDLQASF